VNKADGNNEERARATRAELERAVAFLSPCTEGWKPPVLAISSLTGAGMKELRQAILDFEKHVRATGQDKKRRKEQAIAWWRTLIDQELRSRFFSDPTISSASLDLEARIRAGTLTPSVAAEQLLDAIDFSGASFRGPEKR
jgi:LAO/AO transport system kinase